MRHNSLFCTAAMLCTALGTGCAMYERRPLTLTTHIEAWSQQSLDIPSVQSFLDELNASSGSADAVPFRLEDGLSLREAEAVALCFNADLRIARAAANVPLASAKEAGWWPDPHMQAEILRFANRGTRGSFEFDGPSLDGINPGVITGNGARGLEATPLGYRRSAGDFIEDPWIVGANLSMTVPVSGRLLVEESLKWSEYHASWQRIAVAEWQLLKQLRAAWLAWSTSAQKQQVIREYLRQLSSIADIATRLANAGELHSTDAQLINLAQIEQTVSLLELDGVVEQQRSDVFRLMGISPIAPVQLETGATGLIADIPESDRRAAVLTLHPQVRFARARYESAEQRLRLEIREQYPDITIGPSYSFDEGFSRLGLGLGLPIPLWNRNRQAISEARAERDLMRTQAEAAAESAVRELLEIEMRLASARKHKSALVQDMMPTVDEHLTDVQSLLHLGEVNMFLVRDALTTVLSTKLDILSATLREQEAMYELWAILRPQGFTAKALEGIQ